FFSQCEAHTTDSQQLLNELKCIAYSPCNGRLARDKCIQLHDLLSVVLSEVRFFEVKLDEYAPAVPLSRTLSTRYY
ncbi:uncharacterized protein EDB91DRAFT_1030108, partial [Suillus paluster]|uniref:uncharacterized protein n=1 Tax=Suillus paluster TaxID=48578 RepID=UPI001B8849B2